MRDEQHRDDVVTGRAWADFCDALKSAGDLITANSTDDLDRIEGFRYLSRLAQDKVCACVCGCLCDLVLYR